LLKMNVLSPVARGQLTEQMIFDETEFSRRCVYAITTSGTSQVNRTREDISGMVTLT